VVLVLAARYGTLGLFLGLGLGVAALSGASLALGGSLDGLEARTSSLSDLFALSAAILISWMAMLHERRTERSAQKLASAERAEAAAIETMNALQEDIGPLRARHDRIDLCLTMWRELAGRLESGDAVQAARAAVELCTIRSGASAGMVYSWDGAQLSPVARCGRESFADAWTRDISFDRTARAALDRCRPVLASDVDNASEEDSDVAVPIVDLEGRTVLGVMALRGVSPARLRARDIRDLTLVAEWLASSLARSVPVPLLYAAEGATP
jgi:hypothetical protein